MVFQLDHSLSALSPFFQRLTVIYEFQLNELEGSCAALIDFRTVLLSLQILMQSVKLFKIFQRFSY